MEFAAACPSHPGEKRGEAVNQPSSGGELSPVVVEDLLGGSARHSVRRSFNATFRSASSISRGRWGTLSGPCYVPVVAATPAPLVDTGGEGFRQAVEGVVLDLFGLWDFGGS